VTFALLSAAVAEITPRVETMSAQKVSAQLKQGSPTGRIRFIVMFFLVGALIVFSSLFLIGVH
jgi:hypothetical protein